MIKTTAPYKLPQYKILELVVEFEPLSESDNYDPTSIPGSSNPVTLKKEPTPELGSNDHLVLRYKMWMWMRMTKKKSDTLMSRMITFRMKQI
jgi:hypothetical protein